MGVCWGLMKNQGESSQTFSVYIYIYYLGIPYDDELG